MDASGSPVTVKILLVHGIGQQVPGQHLLACAEPLVDFLQHLVLYPRPDPSAIDDVDDVPATAAPTSAEAPEWTVEVARLTPSANAPAHVVLRSSDGQCWLLAESNWAQAFPAPSYGQLARWGLGVVPASMALHALGRLMMAMRRLTAPSDASSGRMAARLRLALHVGSAFAAVVAFEISLLLVPVLLVAMVALMVVALVPSSRLRSGVLRIQQLLSGTIGDTLAFVARPVRASAILTQVRSDLEWIRSTGPAAPVMVIAHSQGAAIAHRILRDDPGETAALLTYGSGLRKLLAAERLSTGTRRDARTAIAGAVALAVGGALVAASALRSTAVFLGVAAGALLATGLVSTTPAWAWLARTVKARPGLVSVVVVLAFVAVSTWSWQGAGNQVMLQGFVILLGAAAALAREGEAIPDAELVLPRTRRWLDLIGSSDPVPSPWIRTAPEPVHQRVETIPLRGSMWRDHTAYWSCVDSFVWRVAVAVQKVTGDDSRRITRQRGRAASLGRERRLSQRQGGLLVFLLALLVAGSVRVAKADAQVVSRLERSGERFLRWAQLSPPHVLHDPVAVAAVVGVALVAAGIGHRVALLPWDAWQRAEVRDFLAGRPSAPELIPAMRTAHILLVGWCVALVLELAWYPPRDVVAAQYSAFWWGTCVLAIGYFPQFAQPAFGPVVAAADPTLDETEDRPRRAAELVRQRTDRFRHLWWAANVAVAATILILVILVPDARNRPARSTSLVGMSDRRLVPVVVVVVASLALTLIVGLARRYRHRHHALRRFVS